MELLESKGDVVGQLAEGQEMSSSQFQESQMSIVLGLREFSRADLWLVSLASLLLLLQATARHDRECYSLQATATFVISN